MGFVSDSETGSGRETRVQVFCDKGAIYRHEHNSCEILHTFQCRAIYTPLSLKSLSSGQRWKIRHRDRLQNDEFSR